MGQLKHKRDYEDSFPMRHALKVHEKTKIRKFVERRQRFNTNDMAHFRNEFGCSQQAIVKVLDLLNMPLTQVEAPIPAKPKTPQNKEQAAPTQANNNGPTKQVGSGSYRDDFVDDLLAKYKKMKRVEETMRAKTREADEALIMAELAQEEADKQIRDTGRLRMQTMQDLKSIEVLKERIEDLEQTNRKLRAKNDPNSPEWVERLGTFNVDKLQADLKDAHKTIDRLQGQLAAFQASDPVDLQEYFVQYIPKENLPALLVATHFELERREKGGRVKHI